MSGERHGEHVAVRFPPQFWVTLAALSITVLAGVFGFGLRLTWGAAAQSAKLDTLTALLTQVAIEVREHERRITTLEARR